MANTPAKKDQPGALTKFEQFVKFAQGRAELETRTSEETAQELARKQVIRIAESESIDDLFAAMETEGLTGLKFLSHGTELELLDYRLVKSQRPDYANQISVYAIINAVNLHTGEQVALDTGVERVIGFLLKCDQLDAFPVQVQVSKKTTESGHEMVTVVKPPQRVAAKHAAASGKPS